jgi:oligopeptide transport system permease protein
MAGAPAVLRAVLLRLVGGVAVLLAVATLCFALLHAAPGGPFDSEAKTSAAVQRALRERYHLDEPLHLQYLRYLAGLARGELGASLRQPRTVAELIAEHLPASAALGGLALMLAVALGLGLGVLAAWRHRTWIDVAAVLATLVGLALPSFVLGPLLIWAFAMQLGVLPPARLDGASSYLLPACSLGLVYAGALARLGRAGMLEVLRQDFIRTARAKGLGERAVVLRHAARLGLGAALTYLGPASAALISGSFVVEKIFQVPGLGYSFVTSIAERDYPLTTGVFLFYVALIVLANLLVDGVHALLDPRLGAPQDGARGAALGEVTPR